MTARLRPDPGGPTAWWDLPLRVNLRYHPGRALVTVRGRLTEPFADELRRVLAVLRALPAPIAVDLREVTAVDAGGAGTVTAESCARRGGGLPLLTVVRVPLETGVRRAWTSLAGATP